MAVTTGDATFTFWVNYYSVGTTASDAELFVDISTDGGSTFANGVTDYIVGTLTGTWTQYTIDLTANIGQNVTLRFRAISDYGYYNIAVDDVAGPALNLPAHDLGINSISTNGFIHADSTSIPVVNITNFGNNAETGFTVTLTDGGTYNEIVTYSASIASMASDDVTFPVYDPAMGNSVLTATITLASDVNLTNNTLTNAIESNYGYGFGSVVLDFPSHSSSVVGVETDGTYIYGQHWNSAIYERYDMNGNFVDSFILTSASSPRDLAFDGTYFYGAAGSVTLFKMDFTQGAEVVVGTITAPVATRALAFDEDDSTFWSNNGGSDLTEFSMTGVATGRSFTPSVSIYGAAYDGYSNPSNPTMWGNDWGGVARLWEWTLTGSPTGRVIDLTANYVSPDGGGLAIYDDGCTAYILADFQTDPNTIAKVFLKNLSTSTDNEILTFSFDALAPAVVGTVDAVNHTVALLVPSGTDVTALIPTITTSTCARISPASGISTDFTAPVVYSVITGDFMSKQNWTVTVTIESSISEASNSTFTLYPNPASDVINLDMSNFETGEYTIELLDVNGKVISNKVVNFNGNMVSINVDGIAAGSYVLRVRNDSNSFQNVISID